ncbi:DUF2812 domain-containing protein [Clostridium sp.]|uniref:DUF2812 domain-containing protein n=1 Tax=Clostridium sp. TaxID=1506 RepID=UPI002FCAFB09
MGRASKRVSNLGYAFDEKRALERFRCLSKEGWILEKANIFNYVLTKGEEKEQIYSMDYRDFSKDKDGLDEYIEIFKGAGWEYVCSSQNVFHFFKATPGTNPIYTSSREDAEKYIDVYKTAKVSLIVSLIGILLCSIGIIYLDIKTIGLILMAASVGILIPSIMIMFAIKRKLNKV